MTRGRIGPGQFSDGELVQAATDSFDFTALPKVVSVALLLPAVLDVPAGAGREWTPDADLFQDRQPAPGATADEDHRKWSDLLSMGGGVVDDEGTTAPRGWDFLL